MINYPIKFEPILHSKIWGGSKLGSILKKKVNSENIGESWEISAVPGNISVVSNGFAKGKDLMELISIHKNEFLGSGDYKKFGGKFPLLIKFIDSFIIYMCTEGSSVIATTEKSTNIEKGETVLIPAINEEVSITAKSCELLEIYI